MTNAARKPIELSEELRAFAEERVRSGKSGSVDEVVRDAVEAQKRAALRDAIDEGIGDLDAGLGIKTTPDALMAEISDELGLDSSSASTGREES